MKRNEKERDMKEMQNKWKEKLEKYERNGNRVTYTGEKYIWTNRFCSKILIEKNYNKENTERYQNCMLM